MPPVSRGVGGEHLASLAGDERRSFEDATSDRVMMASAMHLATNLVKLWIQIANQISR